VVVAPASQHDTGLLAAGVAQLAGVPLPAPGLRPGTAVTLDAAFDSTESRACLRAAGLAPVIYPNRRATKAPIAVARLFRWFQRTLYQERYRIERTFAWQDTYRKLATSYDRLPETRLGFRHLSYTMVNFRVTFSTG